MPHNRFFLPNFDHPVLEGKELHHMTRVTRNRVGDTIELFDGKGTLATASIDHLDAKQAHCTLLSQTTQKRPTSQKTLAIPLLRPALLEWTLEKGTEIGADRFLLYLAKNGPQPLPSSHALERFHALLLSATKQSGRLFLPHLEILPSLHALAKTSEPLFFGDPKSPTPAPHPLPPSWTFVSGPPSGFSPEEQTLLEQRATPVRLSPYTLRAETAPLVFLSYALCSNPLA